MEKREDLRASDPVASGVDAGMAGIETLLGMAAASDEFARALISRREDALNASGVALTGAERRVVCAVEVADLQQMIAAVAPRLQATERRVFLHRAAAALTVGAGTLILGSCKEKPPDRTSKQSHFRKARLRKARRNKRIQTPPTKPGAPDPGRPTAAPPTVMEPESPRVVTKAMEPVAEPPPVIRSRPLHIDRSLSRLQTRATGIRPDRPPPPHGRSRPTVGDIHQGVNKILPNAKACYNRYRVKGAARLRVVLSGRTGRPSSVRVLGGFANKPTGRCLRGAFRRMRVKRFNNSTKAFIYPIRFK
jgi:hypothetical protein